MRKIYKGLLFVAVVITSLFSSCTLESSDNGDLDGNWHLISVDDLNTDTTYDYSCRRIFWGVQAKLVYIVDYDGSVESYYCRFSHSGDSLTLSDFYANHWHEDYGDDGGDIPVTNIEDLSWYMLTSVPESFYVESLSSSKMIIRSDSYRMRFRKQ